MAARTHPTRSQVSDWHLHRAIGLCEAERGWQSTNLGPFTPRMQLPGSARGYGAACAGGVYSFWQTQNQGTKHPEFASASWCDEDAVPASCRFWAPQTEIASADHVMHSHGR